MAKLFAGIIVAVLVALAFSDEQLAREKRQITVQVMSLNDFFQMLCQNNVWAPYLSVCSSFTSTTPATTPSMTTPYQYSSSEVPSTTAAAVSNTTESPSALERAHWCEFTNGTYIPLGYTFMHTECSLCQCTQGHAILCTTLQCMPAYCLDNSAPALRSGQCCSQCSYERNATACVINGISFPHGTILRKTSDHVTCWCQLGTVECRQYSSTLFAGLDLWGEGTAVSVIVIIICVMLIIGTLICSAGALFFYYYYKRSMQATQQAYEHYYNSAGWQPMDGEGQVVDPTAEEKKAEAEQGQYEYAYPSGNSEEYIPPPYALYNGSYKNEQPENEEK
jgi:hypothetical protein